MKKLFYVLTLLTISFVSVAQRPSGGKDEWIKKVKAEKIAFITEELSLTEQEAQALWPVYNAAEKEGFECMGAYIKSYKVLKHALKEGKSDEEIAVLLDAYISAGEKSRSLERKYLPEYQKVLPVSKVAKLYVAEEKFRRMQMNRLNGGKPDKPKKNN